MLQKAEISSDVDSESNLGGSPGIRASLINEARIGVILGMLWNVCTRR